MMMQNVRDYRLFFFGFFWCQWRGWNDKAKWFDHSVDRGMEGNENMMALDNTVLLICKFVVCSGIWDIEEKSTE